MKRETKKVELEPTTSKETTKTTKIETDFEMPEMEKDPSVSQYDEVFFLKPVTKDCAYFQISKKVGEVYQVSPRKDFNAIGGQLKKIETGSYDYKGEEKKTFKIHLVKESKVLDKETNETIEKKYLYIISGSFTNTARTVINCILSAEGPIDRMFITIKHVNGFTNAEVSINGVQVKWKDNKSGPGKYTREDKEKYVRIAKHPITGKDLPADYTEWDEFLQTELMKHIKVILPNQESVRILPEQDVNDILPDVDDEDYEIN